MDTTQPLTEKQEVLIEKYVDGECGILSKFKARRLLANNRSARQFLDSLLSLAEELRDFELKQNNPKVDMWDQVSMRIEQEERAERFLGKRNESEKVSAKVSWTSLGWGFSGSLVTAGIVGVVIAFSGRSNPSSKGDDFTKRLERSLEVLDAQGDSRPSAQNVNLPVSSTLRRPVEVDWMRSDGRVHMIQDPQERSAIIWVKRQHPGLAAIDDGSDAQSLARPSNRPVIINERIPDALSVSNQH